MLELRNYDDGISSYINRLDIKKMPLLSWNFYGDYLSQLNHHFSDKNLFLHIGKKENWKYESEIQKNWDIEMVVVVTCPSLKIVYATKNMVRMNGYQPEEVIGQSPKMFQGEATCPKTSLAIRNAVQNQQPFEKIVTNYCKDGSTYKCHIKAFPVFDRKGNLKNFIAFEKVA